MPRPSSQLRTACASASVTAGHGGHQGRLAEPFLINPGGIEQIILDDGVIHAHAALIEDAEDCLARLEIAGQRRAQLPLRSRQSRQIEFVHMAQIMFDRMFLQPLPQTAAEEFVLEILAPQGAEGSRRLVQAAIQIQHAHQAGPLALTSSPP